MAGSSDMDGAAAGLAALSICESLLLAISDLKIMSREDIASVLEDATGVHRTAAALGTDAALHREVVALIERIKASLAAV